MSKVIGFRCDWCEQSRDPKQLIGSEIRDGDFYHIEIKKAEKHICIQCIKRMNIVLEERMKKSMMGKKTN